MHEFCGGSFNFVYHLFDIRYKNVVGKICGNTDNQSGHGSNHDADEAAVNSMRTNLGKIEDTKTIIRIGEGERDKAPMLFIGEEIGFGSFQIDLAVDPLENTNALPVSVFIRITASRM